MSKYKFHMAAGGILAAILLLVIVIGPGKSDLGAKGKPGSQGAGPQVVLHLGWGAGPMEAGRSLARESAPEGPMSFTVSAGGQIYLLDQVNMRLLKFSAGGALLSPLPVPEGAFQDIEVAGDGSIILLDRLARRSVVVLGPDGAETAAHPVAGPWIPEGGGITAMFLEEDGLWLEYNHERIVRFLDGSLQPCAATVLEGRKSGTGGQTVAAALAGQGRVRLDLIDAASGTKLAGKEINLGPDLYRIAWVQGDAQGSIHAMFHLVQGASLAGQPPPAEKILAFRFDGKIDQSGRFESPFTIRAWEQFREFKVLPGGQVYQMAFTDDGVEILKWRYEP